MGEAGKPVVSGLASGSDTVKGTMEPGRLRPGSALQCDVPALPSQGRGLCRDSDSVGRSETKLPPGSGSSWGRVPSYPFHPNQDDPPSHPPDSPTGVSAASRSWRTCRSKRPRRRTGRRSAREPRSRGSARGLPSRGRLDLQHGHKAHGSQRAVTPAGCPPSTRGREHANMKGAGGSGGDRQRDAPPRGIHRFRRSGASRSNGLMVRSNRTHGRVPHVARIHFCHRCRPARTTCAPSNAVNLPGSPIRVVRARASAITRDIRRRAVRRARRKLNRCQLGGSARSAGGEFLQPSTCFLRSSACLPSAPAAAGARSSRQADHNDRPNSIQRAMRRSTALPMSQLGRAGHPTCPGRPVLCRVSNRYTVMVADVDKSLVHSHRGTGMQWHARHDCAAGGMTLALVQLHMVHAGRCQVPASRPFLMVPANVFDGVPW